METLTDYQHPLVQRTAKKLIVGVSDPSDKFTRIFEYVRDEIPFGFPPEGDFVKASQTIERGYGQCNTKGILLLALCKAVGIPARLHFSRISKEIQHGFFTGLFYRFMPTEITHSWLEVELDGKWHRIDTYINDLALHAAALVKLKETGMATGYSVSRVTGEPSAELDLSNEKYSQMGAVIADDGICSEPAVFFSGSNYLNRPGKLKQWLYRLYLPLANHRIRQLRKAASNLPVK